MVKLVWLVLRISNCTDSVEVEGVYKNHKSATLAFNDLCFEEVVQNELFGRKLAPGPDLQTSIQIRDYYQELWRRNYDPRCDPRFEIVEQELREF